MKKLTAKQKIEVLRSAISFLKSGACEFACEAIWEVCRQKKYPLDLFSFTLTVEMNVPEFLEQKPKWVDRNTGPWWPDGSHVRIEALEKTIKQLEGK